MQLYRIVSNALYQMQLCSIVSNTVILICCIVSNANNCVVSNAVVSILFVLHSVH